MEKINILYIGKHPEIQETVVRLINQNESWNGIGTGSNEVAIALFTKINFSIVLFGPGITPEEENGLRKTFGRYNSGCAVIQHYGGGSGLLNNEILAALGGTSV
jgi:hypothetical protein